MYTNVHECTKAYTRLPQPELTRARARANQLLRSFPAQVLADLLPSLEPQSLGIKASLYEADKPMRHVYFVLDGVASVIATSPDSNGVEVATIGREGMVGLPAFLGGGSTVMTAFIQVPGNVARLGVPAFRKLCSESGQVTAVMLRYTQAFITQIAQASACNRMHPIDERCARWLLQTHDRVGRDNFGLTQEFLSQMLGVRRASVSEAAGTLQDKGLIRYDRGDISILDRGGLEEAACECYAIIMREYARLIGMKPASA